jgi:tetracycline repressor-like protein
VHPDFAFRDHATAMKTKATTAQGALSQNRGVYQALTSLDLSKADATVTAGNKSLLACELHSGSFCRTGIEYGSRDTCRKIRWNATKNMRYPLEETSAKRERIVKEASRPFRERGFENVGVGGVMKAAGLTHGAFYAHVGSKEELQLAAVGKLRAHFCSIVS